MPHAKQTSGRSPAESTAEAIKTKRNTFRLLRSRGCYTLILARFFTDPVIYFILFWLPRYLEKGRGFDIAMVGRYAWMPFCFGGIGYIFGGWLSGRLMRVGWSLPRARKTAMLVGACFLPSAILAPLRAHRWPGHCGGMLRRIWPLGLGCQRPDPTRRFIPSE